MSEGIALDPACVREFGLRLAGLGKRRLGREALWSAFADAFRDRPGGAEGRGWLLAALEGLEREGLLRIPGPRSTRWDRSFLPHVPNSVDIEAGAHDRRDDSWRTEPWPLEMSWIPDLVRLSDDQIRFLRRVRQGVREGWFRDPAPLRYRSLQLTGDEKRLERQMATALFDEGRLSADLLNLHRDVLPLAWERVGPGGAVLVFENSAPFSVARGVLSAMERPMYGIVAYGGGRGFEQSVEHLLTIGCEVTTIDYVGDLDEPGLEIALGARETARRTDVLPEVRPAPAIHAAMLQAAAKFGHPDGWPDPKRAGTTTPSLADFIPAEVRSRVQEIIAIGRRIPEEVLGPEEMRALWTSAGG